MKSLAPPYNPMYSEAALARLLNSLSMERAEARAGEVDCEDTRIETVSALPPQSETVALRISSEPQRDSVIHIPPVALIVSFLSAAIWPPLRAVIVTCHVPPEAKSPLPSYVPSRLSVALTTVRIAAMPIEGIAGM